MSPFDYGVKFDSPSPDPYIRRAALLEVIDGDTFDLLVDLGFHASMEIRVRLIARDGVGVDAPETRTKDLEEKRRGLEAMDFARDWLDCAETLAEDQTWPLTIRTEKDDSFGRWLAQIEDALGYDLGNTLLHNGYAKEWKK